MVDCQGTAVCETCGALWSCPVSPGEEHTHPVKLTACENCRGHNQAWGKNQRPPRREYTLPDTEDQDEDPE